MTTGIITLLIIVAAYFLGVYSCYFLTRPYRLEYKNKWFEEQGNRLYRAMLFIAIKDMVDNKWYDNFSWAFRMLYIRLVHYRLNNESEEKLFKEMMFHQDRAKYSPEYEQYLLNKRN